MTEWILIFTMHLAGQPGEIRDITQSMLGGFTSQAACITAASKLADRTIVLVGQARERQGIQPGTSRSGPIINTECVSVTK